MAIERSRAGRGGTADAALEAGGRVEGVVRDEARAARPPARGRESRWRARSRAPPPRSRCSRRRRAVPTAASRSRACRRGRRCSSPRRTPRASSGSTRRRRERRHDRGAAATGRGRRGATRGSRRDRPCARGARRRAPDRSGGPGGGAAEVGLARGDLVMRVERPTSDGARLLRRGGRDPRTEGTGVAHGPPGRGDVRGARAATDRARIVEGPGANSRPAPRFRRASRYCGLPPPPPPPTGALPPVPPPLPPAPGVLGSLGRSLDEPVPPVCGELLLGAPVVPRAALVAPAAPLLVPCSPAGDPVRACPPARSSDFSMRSASCRWPCSPVWVVSKKEASSVWFCRRLLGRLLDLLHVLLVVFTMRLMNSLSNSAPASRGGPTGAPGPLFCLSWNFALEVHAIRLSDLPQLLVVLLVVLDELLRVLLLHLG